MDHDMDMDYMDHAHIRLNLPQDARNCLGYCGHQVLISYETYFS